MARVVKRVVSCRLGAPRRPGFVDVGLEEAVVLDDGRRLTIRHDRGFTCTDQHPITLADLHLDITNTLLPDEPSVTGQVASLEQGWRWAVVALARAGIVETADQLEAAPLEIEYGTGILELLVPA